MSRIGELCHGRLSKIGVFPHKRQNICIVASLPQEHIARRVAVMKNKLVS